MKGRERKGTKKRRRRKFEKKSKKRKKERREKEPGTHSRVNYQEENCVTIIKVEFVCVV
jgi:hypothetical protein